MRELALPADSLQTPVIPTAVAPRASRKRGSSDDGASRRRALWLLASSLGLGAATCLAIVKLDWPRLGVVGFTVAALLALAGALYALVALVRGLRAAPAAPWTTTVVALLALAGNACLTLVGAFAALLSTGNFSRGRQLRRWGRVLLPPVGEGGTWADRGEMGAVFPTLDEATRGALARQWRENGRTEHASVAAFARLTLDLMALGAPPALVASANRDALDEIHHAELCFSLARAIDGGAEGPGPFPEAARARTLPGNRTLALALLAVDSLVDGALHEGLSARVVAKLVARCEEPVVRDILKTIARDEGRHAAHGWDVVRFCLAEGGEPVAHALRGAMRALPDRMRSTFDDRARGGDWERYGITGAALEAEEHARARADVVRRVAELIAQATRRAA